MVNKKDIKGFTLIELMIVVVIIGILSAIVAPNFRNYYMKAKRSEAPVNLKALKLAEEAYRGESGSYKTLTASPSANPVSGNNQMWVDKGGFAELGWQPQGKIYGVYETIGAASASAFSGQVRTDVDGNGIQASFTCSESTDITGPNPVAEY
ncbi:MAG: prepilin-type N-terminal cleavage/methylation domain-containing protein [Desulfobacterales bacterium]|nr:prepilin-type N-terminal cleavage/methylation domain-containing protein [Desulfobacterales bacterium]MBF0397392.1 prepilin-type N-terminal cleavage/methylation domain-containing protein [Desulfobacterales bacterium]